MTNGKKELEPIPNPVRFSINGVSFDVIITDLKMSHGRTGLDIKIDLISPARTGEAAELAERLRDAAHTPFNVRPWPMEKQICNRWEPARLTQEEVDAKRAAVAGGVVTAVDWSTWPEDKPVCVVFERGPEGKQRIVNTFDEFCEIFGRPVEIKNVPDPGIEMIEGFADIWWAHFGDEFCPLDRIYDRALWKYGDLGGGCDGEQNREILRRALTASKGMVISGRWILFERFNPHGFALEELETWDARNVPIVVPCERCAAPGCGEKIKPFDSSDTMIELTNARGNVRYIEHGCAGYWVHGNPEGGHPKGSIRWPDGTITSYDPNHWTRKSERAERAAFGSLPRSGVTITPIKGGEK